MVELWGTAPQSKMTISQRIQNHHCIAAVKLYSFTLEIASF